ncbi:MAG: B12-binding domain-containing radical SAM protein [Gemmatimonadota bacterium]
MIPPQRARLTLVHPPLADPTVPYHSTAYLAGSLKARGFRDVTQRDANIEFVDWCLSERTFAGLVEEARDRRERLAAKSELRLDEQAEFYELWRLDEIGYDAVADAVTTQRNLDRFLDFDAYERSVRMLRTYFGLVGVLSHPGAIDDFTLVTNERFSFTSLADLSNVDLSRRVCWPFYRFLDEVWARDPVIDRTTCLGISITYQHQLFHALALARWFRTRWPDRKVLLGGTEVSQIYRSIRDKAELRSLFAVCDGLVIGEGETAIGEIAEAGFELAPGARIQNTVTYDSQRDEVYLPTTIAYEDLRSIAPPDYDPPWDLYLSPVRAVNYSPTRGCYWNRCAFCSYGLSDDAPTAPWRTRPVEWAAGELADTCRKHGIGYVYLAVDAISPAYLGKLSDALIRRDTRFKWSAEMRLERAFPRHACEKLAQSGCVSALFGMESGSQRVLDAMNKGTKVEHMRESIRNFADAGIAVQLMVFSGFPTETSDDRRETIEFLAQCGDHWSNGGLGSFVLLDGSIIAKAPQRFGIRLRPINGCDINAIRAFEFVEPEGTDARDDEHITAYARRLFPRSFPRPWAGGADTLHSMVYYHRHGRAFFRTHPLADPAHPPVPVKDEALVNSTTRLRAGVGQSWFDLCLLLANLERWRQQLALSERDAHAATYASYRGAAARASNLHRGDEPYFYLHHRGKCVQVPTAVHALIGDAVATGRSVADMFAGLPSEASRHLASYLRKLQQLGVIAFEPGD